MELPVSPDDLATDVTTGEQREPLRVTAPADGRRIGSVPQCLPADVRLTVDRAQQAQKRWAERAVSERATLLRDVAASVYAHRSDLLDTVCLETGKARRDAAEEVADVMLTARYYAEEGPGMLAARRHGAAAPLVTKAREYVDPLGVVGFITPWNYPLTLVVSDALPALLAGNTVVVKADERTPFTALYVRRVLLEAGLPPGIFQVVTGEGERLGAPLIEAVDGIGFTGSTSVGREVAARAGRELTPASLELGGKNPLIVLPDASPSRAAAGTIRGAFAGAGQLCVGIERVFVHECVSDQYIEELVTRTEHLRLGVSGEWGIDVGSLLSGSQLGKVRAHVSDAIERGATLRTGGQHRPEIGPWVYEPTILTDVPDTATLTTEETFGPVLAVHVVDSVEAAVRAANDSPYGLNASVWGEDTNRAERVARQIRCGTVNVNETYAAAWSAMGAPMGGMKDSGLGRRHGRHGLERWTQAQTVATQRWTLLSPPWLPDRTWAAIVFEYLHSRDRIASGFNRLREKLDPR